MSIFLFFEKHQWVIALSMLLVSTLIYAVRFSAYSVDRPDLKHGYTQLLYGWIILGIIPVIILFLANEFGRVQLKGNGHFTIWTILLHSYGVLVSLFLIWWTFFRDGASFLRDHPGFIRMRIIVTYENVTSLFWIKFILGALSGGILLNIVFWWIRST